MRARHRRLRSNSQLPQHSGKAQPGEGWGWGGQASHCARLALLLLSASVRFRAPTLLQHSRPSHTICDPCLSIRRAPLSASARWARRGTPSAAAPTTPRPSGRCATSDPPVPASSLARPVLAVRVRRMPSPPPARSAALASFRSDPQGQACDQGRDVPYPQVSVAGDGFAGSRPAVRYAVLICTVICMLCFKGGTTISAAPAQTASPCPSKHCCRLPLAGRKTPLVASTGTPPLR